MKKLRCIFLAWALTVSLSGGVPPMPAKSDSDEIHSFHYPLKVNNLFFGVPAPAHCAYKLIVLSITIMFPFSFGEKKD